MSSLLWHTIVDLEANWFRISDLDNSDLYRAASDFNYQLRHPISNQDLGRFSSLWPRASMISGDETANVYLLGNDNETVGGLYEPWNCVFAGGCRTWFLKGQVKDSNSNPLGAAKIEWFLTATDAYLGDCTTDSNGYYQMPFVAGIGTVYGVANYNNGQYVGSTVNTLQPAL